MLLHYDFTREFIGIFHVAKYLPRLPSKAIFLKSFFCHFPAKVSSCNKQSKHRWSFIPPFNAFVLFFLQRKKIPIISPSTLPSLHTCLLTFFSSGNTFWETVCIFKQREASRRSHEAKGEQLLKWSQLFHYCKTNSLVYYPNSGFLPLHLHTGNLSLPQICIDPYFILLFLTLQKWVLERLYCWGSLPKLLNQKKHCTFNLKNILLLLLSCSVFFY